MNKVDSEEWEHELSGPFQYQLIYKTCEKFPDVDVAFRKLVAEGPITKTALIHRSKETKALWCLEVVGAPPVTVLNDGVKVAFWNVERCKYIGATATWLTSVDADINLLCELDMGMARSFQLHTTRELAKHLKQSYAFGVEYVELSLGDTVERTLHRGQDNQQGLHGNAILCKGPLNNVALIRLEANGHWFLNVDDERRLGGRIAIAATIVINDVNVTLVCTHFEARGTPQTRAAEMHNLLAAVDEYSGTNNPVLIAGDLNTSTSSRERIYDPKQRLTMLGEDPMRLENPVQYEPLFEVAATAGFDWINCNARGATQRPHIEPRFERKLDWIFTRGLKASNAEVVSAKDKSGQDMSDHDMITVMIIPEEQP